MITNYTQHAANERTYLSWVRTAVALMTFGFFIEKFDIVMDSLHVVTKGKRSFHVAFPAEIIGLTLFFIGAVIIVMATIRFFRHKRLIELTEIVPYRARKAKLVLSVSMVGLAVLLFFYISQRLFT